MRFCMLLLLILASGIANAQKENAWQSNHLDSAGKAIAKTENKIEQLQGKLSKSTGNIIKSKDSLVQNLQEIPDKFIKNVDSKIEKYSGRITKKTEKTLEKLSRWESKIKTTLEKVNPEMAKRLFADNQLTFSVLLQKMKSGESAVKQYHARYDAYRDKLTTSLNYLDQQKANLDEKMLKPLAKVRSKMDSLSSDIDKAEDIQQLIKERKKQLIDAAFQNIGNNKYLSKINKETWYYVEIMRNYKQIFNDQAKAEQTAKTILNNIPAFQNFMQQNSMLASLFGQPGDMANSPSLAGLQTRADVQSLIQTRIAAGGANAQQIVSGNLQAAQAKLNVLKDKLLKNPYAGNGGGSAPDFKPNMQKTKTFKQRLEWGTDVQFARTNSLMPATSDIAVTLGYKLNDKSVAGIGASYKLGLGTIDNIHFTNQGLSLRSFIDWKLKHQFFISGGYEMNYLAKLSEQHISSMYEEHTGNWQKSALVGISKKIKAKNKWFKNTKLQLLYDFLAKQHIPVSQSLLFRVGYNF